MKENQKRDLIVFTRQLSLIIDSDVSVFEGLDLIKSKTDSAYIRVIVDKILEHLHNGYTLSESISAEKSLPALFRSMVTIGEQSGDLSFALEQVASSYEKELETSNKLKQAITYPVILSVLMVGVILLLILKILPMFNNILLSLGGTMPAITQVILNIALALNANIVPVAIIFVVVLIALIAFFSSKKGKAALDYLKLHTPIVKDIYSSLLAVTFSRNLSMLYKAGIPLSESLEMLKPVLNNVYVSGKLDMSKTQLEAGEEADKVIEKLNIFPWILIKLFSVAQTTGHMEKILLKVSLSMEEEVDEKLARLTSVVEPVLIIALSFVIGIILVSVMLPVINIMNTIG